MTLLFAAWLVASVLALGYLVSLELMTRRLQRIAPAKFADLGSPTIVPWKAIRGGTDRRQLRAATTSLIRFLLRRGYLEIGDHRLNQLALLASAGLFLSVAALIGLMAVRIGLL